MPTTVEHSAPSQLRAEWRATVIAWKVDDLHTRAQAALRKGDMAVFFCLAGDFHRAADRYDRLTGGSIRDKYAA